MTDDEIRETIIEAVNVAVGEALKRVQTVEPIVGTCEAVDGVVADVRLPETTMVIPTTRTSAAIVAGSQVLVVFYGAGRAWSHGPLPVG